jgi:hypothetical protein
MKIMRSAVICLAMILLSAAVLHGQNLSKYHNFSLERQDLSKYRNFTLGMSLADLSKQIDAKPADVKVIHQHPARIEELTWWPRVSGYPPPPEAIREIHFSFCDGKLYQIYVTYDDKATEGMTAEDMARAISARYGTPTTPDAKITFSTGGYATTEKVIDRWEDSKYSVNLFRSSFSTTFGLVMFIKQVNAEAEVAINTALRLEQEGAPQKEVDRKKKEADDLEASRVKNMKTFHP